MSGWFIFGGIVLLLVLLFTRSVVATVEYNEEKLDVKVKYLFFTLYPQKPKRKKSPKKKKRRSAEARRTDEPDDEERGEPPEERAEQEHVGGGEVKRARNQKMPKKKKRKKSAFDLAQIMDYVRSASPPIKRLFKKIRVSDLSVNYIVATDDAAKTAIKYGTVCAALYPAIEWLTTYFTVHVRRVHVEADFSKETDDILAYGKLKLRVSTALGCILWLGVRMIKTYFKYQKKQEVQA